MKRLVLALAFLAACGAKGKKGDGTSPDDGDGVEPARLERKAIVSFGTEEKGGATRAWLVVTDETSAAKSFPLEDVSATGCGPATGGDLDAIGKLECTSPPLRLIVVARQGHFIILDQNIDPATGEAGEYEEQTRIVIPEGAAVSFQE